MEEVNKLKESINDLIYEFNNGHINAFELVRQLKELIY